MATEFDNSLHWGFFLTGPTLTSDTGKYVRMSNLVLSALRAAGVFSNMVDGIEAPDTDKLWLDKNFDPAVLKEWDATGASWVPMTYGRLFGRAAVDKLTVTGGTGNAVVVSQPDGFQASRLYLITPTADNTGATTVQVAGVGTFDVKYGDGTDIDPNEFTTGRQAVLFFTGARFEVVFPVGDLNTAVVEAEAAAYAASASASDAASSAASAASAASAVVTGATADDTLDDADSLIYLTGTTIKKGALTGLVSSIFKTARKIANGYFLSSFRLWDATDNTKGAAFDLSGITTGQVRTIKLPDKNLDSIDRPLLHVRDQKANNTAGGTSSTGTQVRTLNTVVANGISGASLASNAITLPAGTYEIDARVPGYRTGGSSAWLRRKSDTVLVAGGGAIYDNPASNYATSDINIKGRFTLASSTDLEIAHNVQSGAANGLGQAGNAGNPEIYTEVLIRKVD